MFDSRKGPLWTVWIYGSEYVCEVSSSISILYLSKHLIKLNHFRSIFGEDALANLSIEKPLENPDAPVTGHIRIRAKSQVILY